MLPKKKQGRGNRGFNILLPQVTIAALDEIVAGEQVKSRNTLIGSFLEFSVALFQQKRAIRKQLDEFKERESVRAGRELTDAEVDIALLERGLKASKK